MDYERELEMALKLAESNGFDSVQYVCSLGGCPFFRAVLSRFADKVDGMPYYISVSNNTARFLDMSEASQLVGS